MLYPIPSRSTSGRKTSNAITLNPVPPTADPLTTDTDTSTNPEIPPPSSSPPFQTPTSSQLYAFPITTNDAQPIILNLEPTPCTTNTRLRRKYLASLAINIVTIFIVLPIVILGVSLSKTCARYDCQCLVPFSNITDFPPGTKFTNTRIILAPNETVCKNEIVSERARVVEGRGLAGPPRFCVTGLKKEVLDQMFADVQAANEHKGKVWGGACGGVEGLDYSDQAVKAEWDFLA